MKVAVCKVEVETFGPDMVVRKIPEDSRFLDVETDATMTLTEIGQWLNSRGWYYAGHHGFSDGHLYTYMPGKHAVQLMVETIEQPAGMYETEAMVGCAYGKALPEQNDSARMMQALERARALEACRLANQHPELTAREVNEELQARALGDVY